MLLELVFHQCCNDWLLSTISCVCPSQLRKTEQHASKQIAAEEPVSKRISVQLASSGCVAWICSCRIRDFDVRGRLTWTSAFVMSGGGVEDGGWWRREHSGEQQERDIGFGRKWNRDAWRSAVVSHTYIYICFQLFYIEFIFQFIFCVIEVFFSLQYSFAASQHFFYFNLQIRSCSRKKKHTHPSFGEDKLKGEKQQW